MKRKYFVLLLIILSLSAFAQEKVVKHDGDGKKWINTLEAGYIITSGRAGELEEAKQKAIESVKQSIVQSVAEHVQVNTTQQTTELNGDVNTFLNTYNSESKTESGDVSFLTGISLSKAEGWYWEKIKNKNTNLIFYRFYIRYPFSDRELNTLIAAYKKYDHELTDRLNAELAIIDQTNSIEELLAAHNRLREMTGIFKDQRRQKVQAGLATFKAIMQSMAVVPIENYPGRMVAELRSGNRGFSTSKLPRITSPCATIEEVSDAGRGVLVTYNYDYCKTGSDQNFLEFYFSAGSVRLKDIVRFDVTAYRVEMSVNGHVIMAVSDDFIELNMAIKTTYDTPFVITRIEVETPGGDPLVFEPLAIDVKGKGVHQILAKKTLGINDISLLNQLKRKAISGRIFYTQTDSQIAYSYRFYKVGYKVEKH